jgi:cobalt-zinc-cadmium efflux system protein
MPQDRAHDHDHGHAHDHDHDHDHAEAHGHDHGLGGHSHAPASFGRAFAIGITINLLYVAAEAFYGISVHSVALLADAGHNLGDVVGLVGAWIAATLSVRRPHGRYTYGLRRSSILAALANAVLLLVVTGGIAWEAVLRLFNPEPSGGFTIVVVGIIGVLVNGATALMFMSGREHDLNIRGAFLHMTADAALTVGVVIAGLVIMGTGWLWVDPLVSLLISVVIVVSTWSLLRDSVNLSLDAVPRGIDAAEVEAYLSSVPGVAEVHDLHIWALGTTETALTAHLVCDEVTRSGALLERLSGELDHRFGIGHATLQVESPETASVCELRPAHVV